MSYKIRPYVLSLLDRGYIEGLTHFSNASQNPLCHFFGGIPYGLPPVGPFRFARPRPLPPCYKYGTRVNPGRFNGGAAICPQPGFNELPSENAKQGWDENCLQSNVWVPAGKAPNGGWPVLFFIHGGWLQIGTPNSNDLTALLGETNCQCIVVMPAYRLNVFGFLASRELEEEASKNGQSFGNYGFWDQRLALEWTHKNISYFGGDASNITVAGYSAGAHSTFHQLSHDLYLPSNKRIIKRAILHSNGPGMQPKSRQETQEQFDSFLSALQIPLSLSSSEKLSRLRATSPSRIIEASNAISIHEFRAVSDGVFVQTSLFDDIDSGVYAQKLKDASVHILLGECRNENFVYASYRPPRQDSREALRTRLRADYPAVAVDAVLKVYSPDMGLPTWRSCRDWRQGAHGHVFADLQVHAMQRGFVQRLVQGGAGDNVKRYRIEWRAGCCDAMFPKEWGVTHGTDMAIWYFGNGLGGEGLKDEEKSLVRDFARPLWKFLRGEMQAEDWGTTGPLEVRRLCPDGKVEISKDQDWERGVDVYDTVRKAQKTESTSLSAKL